MLIGFCLHPLATFSSFGEAGQSGQIVARFGNTEFKGVVEPGGIDNEISHNYWVSFHAASISKKNACPSGAVPARSNVGAPHTPCT